MTKARADTMIAVCEEQSPDKSAITIEYPRILNEKARFLVITESPLEDKPYCKTLPLPLPANDIHSARLISDDAWEKLK